MATYKLVDTEQLETDLKTVADAIREGSGADGELPFPDGMAAAAREKQSGGGDTRMTQLIEGTLTELYDADATKVGRYALSANKTFTKISLPNAGYIDQYAFNSAEKVTEINLPKAYYLGLYALSSMKSLVNLELPSLKSSYQSSIRGCTVLKTVKLPVLLETPNYLFSNCEALEVADFGSIISIGGNPFQGNYSLKAIIIRTTSQICNNWGTIGSALYHFDGKVNANYNPNGLKDGYIYVPRALIEDYKVATNWTVYADQFRALEDYTVDGTTTGEMDWDKINGGAS